MAKTTAEQIQQKFSKGLFADVIREAEAADQEAQAPEMAAEDKPKKTARKPVGEKKRSTTKKSTPKAEKPVEKTGQELRQIVIQHTKQQEPQEPQQITIRHIEQTEQPEPKTVVWKKVDGEPETKQPKGKPFSIYIRDDVRQKIATYTELTGMKTSQLITEAVLAYMAEHKITAEQKTAYQNRHKMITDIMNELS